MNAKSIVVVVAVIVLAASAWAVRQSGKDSHSSKPGNTATTTSSGEACPEPADANVRNPGEIPLDDTAGLAAKLGVPNGKPAMVDFGSLNCIPCKEMDANMKEARPKLGDAATIMFVNVYEQEKETAISGISIIPTQIFFDANGNETWRHVGVLTVDEIVVRLTAKQDSATEGG